MRRPITRLLPALLAVAVLAAACGGGGEDGGEPAASPPAVTETPSSATTTKVTSVQAVLVSSDLSVGPNSFSVGLLSPDKEPILNAEVNARFFQMVDGQPVLRGEGGLAPVVVNLTYTETHPDGSVETHETGRTGVYKAIAPFNEAGRWMVELTATVQGETLEPVTVPFDVRERSPSPDFGAPAPRSRQTTLSDVDDISEIDTSDPPDPEMHTMTIEEAVTSGRPTLIAFATPGFCASRICGPAKQLVDQFYPDYKDQVNFVHVEPYVLDTLRSGQGYVPIPVMEEWGLQTEPWIFVIDEQGNVAAKFEAVVAAIEIESALQSVTGRGSS